MSAVGAFQARGQSHCRMTSCHVFFQGKGHIVMMWPQSQFGWDTDVVNDRVKVHDSFQTQTF